jgi:L-asparaginase II
VSSSTSTSPVLDASATSWSELAVLERSGLIESRHFGSAIVLGPDGNILRQLGDPSALIYPRSTMKPFQALSALRAGAQLRGVELALATASHAGTPEHIAVVRSILTTAGVSEDLLACPADWPSDSASRAAVTADGGSASAIYMNCSGKHAAFLLACTVNDWPTEGYLEPEHPLQALVRSTVEEFTGEPIVHSGVDGCGAPVHAMSLTALARAIGRVAKGADAETAALSDAFLQNAWAIDGPGRANTVTIDSLGIIAKLGAEGVMVMSTSDGTAVAVKVLDGSLRAATLVALELLVSVGAVARADADAVLAQTLERVLGGGGEVGSIRVAF